MAGNPWLSTAIGAFKKSGPIAGLQHSTFLLMVGSASHDVFTMDLLLNGNTSLLNQLMIRSIPESLTMALSNFIAQGGVVETSPYTVYL